MHHQMNSYQPQSSAYGGGGGYYEQNNAPPPPPPAPEWTEWELSQIAEASIAAEMRKMSEDVRFRSLAERDQRNEWDETIRAARARLAREKEDEERRRREEEQRRIEASKTAGGYATLRDQVRNYFKNLLIVNLGPDRAAEEL